MLLRSTVHDIEKKVFRFVSKASAFPFTELQKLLASFRSTTCLIWQQTILEHFSTQKSRHKLHRLSRQQLYIWFLIFRHFQSIRWVKKRFQASAEILSRQIIQFSDGNPMPLNYPLVTLFLYLTHLLYCVAFEGREPKATIIEHELKTT